jgi:serine/threonine-protein kinase
MSERPPDEPWLEVLATALTGHYALERALGSGGMATVFLARDLHYDRQVALKALKPDLAQAVGADRFIREIRIISQLSHPNVVGLIDSGVAEGEGLAIPWYVMPYVEGETLRERLRREVQLPVEEAVRIAGEVAEALGYAHQRQVIHRDVKPENILLQGDRALVADFGIARLAGGRPATTTISSGGVTVGTPHYMSPEQWDAAPHLDGRSDLYSLGCVLYEMLAGEPPFTGPTIEALAARHRNQRPPPLRVVRGRVPRHLERVVERVLAKLPPDRYQTAEEFQEALSGAARLDLRYGLRRTRPWMLAAAGVVVVALALRFIPEGAVLGPLPPSDIAVLSIVDEVKARPTTSLAAQLTERLAARLDSARGIRVSRPPAGLPLDSVIQRTRAGILVSGTVSGEESQVIVTIRVNDSETPEYPIATRPWARAVGNVLPLADSLAEEITRYVLRAIGRNVTLRERLGDLPPDTRRLVREARGLQTDGYADATVGNVTEATWKLLRADTLLARAEQRQGRSMIATVDRGWVSQTLAQIYLGPDPAVWRRWMDSSIAHADRALAQARGDPSALELRGLGLLVLAEVLQGEETRRLAQEAEAALREAVQRNDSLAAAWAGLSRLRVMEADFDNGAAYARRALEVDPFLREARRTLTTLFTAELSRERFEEARDVCEQGRAEYPSDNNFVECRLQILAWAGTSPADAGHAWREAQEIDSRAQANPMLTRTWGWRRLYVAATLARAGLRDSAWRVIRAVKARDSTPGDLMEARLYALLGASDQALQYVERVLRVQPRYKQRIAAEPWFRGLRDDPRFRRLVD